MSLLLNLVINNVVGGGGSDFAARSLFLGSIGVTSWLMGRRWYGLQGMGLRGKRPLFAGAGFAFLGWLAVLFVRTWYIETVEDRTGSGLADDFLYLLLFEAFALQLWAFGTFFRSVADWRGPLTAAISSGLLFGTVAYLIFIERTYDEYAGLGAFIYFIAWGVFYGIVRLRTGSILGTVMVQALQSLTAWQIFLPQVPASQPASWNWYYTWMSLIFLLLIWRLWPSEEGDYRV